MWPMLHRNSAFGLTPLCRIATQFGYKPRLPANSFMLATAAVVAESHRDSESARWPMLHRNSAFGLTPPCRIAMQFGYKPRRLIRRSGLESNISHSPPVSLVTTASRHYNAAA